MQETDIQTGHYDMIKVKTEGTPEGEQEDLDEDFLKDGLAISGHKIGDDLGMWINALYIF